jgi:hypothetical protein
MTERNPNPASPACERWETILADALDGLLGPEDQSLFASHMEHCPVCAALYEDARKGRAWLEFLAPEPEIPARLVDRILAHTGPGHEIDSARLAVAGAPPALWQRQGFFAHMRQSLEPRLMMTAAMAFFSIALTLNLAGLRVQSLRLTALRPSNLSGLVERQLSKASTPIARYYDHLRVIRQVEAKVRELRRTPQGEGGRPLFDQPQTGPAAPNTTGRTQPGSGQGDPALYDTLESSLTALDGPAFSGGSAPARRDRSAPWIA